MLGNMLIGKAIIRAGYRNKKGKGMLRYIYIFFFSGIYIYPWKTRLNQKTLTEFCKKIQMLFLLIF